MAYAGLTSHHVNYLIWRYLQESGHGDAALMLQRAWNHNPQDFPFASYIKPHALIVLIQKGLQYYDLEQSLDQACHLLAGNAASLSPVSFFGPVASDLHAPAQKVDHGDATDGAVTKTDIRAASPKPTVDGIVNGHVNEAASTPTSGKSRKPTSVKDGDVSLTAGETPMEIDQQETPQEKPPQARASPSVEPVVDADGDVGMRGQNEREPSPPIFTLTVGQSTGVQISPSKAADLGPDTTLLDINADSQITQTLWRPDDPTTVTATGDTFCGLWKLLGPRSSSAPAHEPLVESKGDGTCVTASGWDSAGKMLAVATYQDPMNGSITMYGQDGTAIDLLPDLPRMVSGLYWAPRGLRMAVSLSDGQHSELTLWDQAVRPDEFPAPQVVDGLVHEVSWCGDEMIYACGDGSVYEYRADTDIELTKTFTSADGQEPWTFIDSAMVAGSPVAVTASSSTTKIWVPTHDISISAAHHGDITALELQPQPQSSLLQKSTSLLFATASMDDTVKLWNIHVESKQIQCMHRLYLGPSSPALCSRFSPDGYAIAAATHDKLLIWSVERGGVALAKWTAPRTDVMMKNDGDRLDGAENNNNSNSSSSRMEGLEDSTFYRSLSWDCDGKKLALGFGKQLAIINLQR
ncbi:hypothetical protein GX51_07016 [Blastomyces parvus]|uniref:LisH domain-containing protein n=1 Tax=Blastomyces parvus TaxID=2060905 RepID=A0A2B7WN42_9EURO|nr:hypothetical protein GX51_07016 [Blastomyces parvus]